MVYWSLISNRWNHNCDDALPSRDSWTSNYWQSCINKLNIVNHICMVTIIGQIKPWGSCKTRTTRFIRHMEQVQSSLRWQFEFSDVEVCQEMNCKFAKWSVNRSLSAHCHIGKSGYTHRDAWKLQRNNWKNTLEHSSNAIFQGNLDFIFLSLGVQSTKLM